MQDRLDVQHVLPERLSLAGVVLDLAAQLAWSRSSANNAGSEPAIVSDSASYFSLLAGGACAAIPNLRPWHSSRPLQRATYRLQCGCPDPGWPGSTGLPRHGQFRLSMAPVFRV